MTISKAVHQVKNFKNKLFTILVDGLGEKDQRYYGSELRKLGVPSRKVRGIKKDENNALIRLADSICGFVRDIKEGDEGIAEKIFKEAVRNKVIVQI